MSPFHHLMPCYKVSIARNASFAISNPKFDWDYTLGRLDIWGHKSLAEVKTNDVYHKLNLGMQGDGNTD